MVLKKEEGICYWKRKKKRTTATEVNYLPSHSLSLPLIFILSTPLIVSV